MLAVIALQAATIAYLHRDEVIPVAPALSDIPDVIGRWRLAREDRVHGEALENLQPDAYVNRTYRSDDSMANLFIAYFNSQRDGRVPHSPKNCLPSSGWLPVWRRQVEVALPDGKAPMVCNQFLIAKGREQMMVYYLYLTSRRAVASDYSARMFLALDAMRYNRTDTMLVRMIVPVQQNEEQSTRHLTDFAGQTLASLRQIYRE